MQSNKLRTAIKATTAVVVLGVAGQASAANFSAGEYDMSVYGYARLNASYDIDEEVGISTRSGAYSAINTTDADEPTGVFGADAVQTRIGVKTTTPEGVNITVEGDFRGGTLRLRHGFGEYNGVLMGQTWSNFNSFVGNTSTLDFDSLPGLAGLQGRVAQARYTTGPLSFSLEQPNASLLVNSTTVDDEGNEVPIATDPGKKDSMPAITARLEDSAGGFSYSAAVLAHQVGYDTGTLDESAFGFATFGAAKLALSDMFTIQGTVSYSDGANSYLYRSGENFGAASAYVDASGDVETISGYGASVGTGISLGGGRSVNIGYGMATVDWDDAEADGLNGVGGQSETNSAVMANYQWTPVNNVMMGVEYQLLSRENVDGSDGDASRVLFAAQYNF
ncbi:DcaP family trimeric outer membrane transporter [Marinobacter sp. chi1]|uniref:DcaP family trimeric outer membrane transporter n=1 Tax=Marinobacter suaedae TaxID=3057675 RepID=A0ABT8VXZ8_9GAMM|nr:DcaP family trimeric outer membrane transporter [Marinobacter sp. chi1]MDO3720867.1 DcaP family trimeric outer membrane transporter [Marinobacter sp. chi1]